MSLDSWQTWIAEVRAKAETILEGLDAGVGDPSDRARRRFKSEIETTVGLLTELAGKVDPTRQPGAVFNPFDPSTIGRMIALCMANRQLIRLIEIDDDPFYGGGVYGLYYCGQHPAYAAIGTDEDLDVPIYVGKADPADAQARTATDQGRKLWTRLREHLKSIRHAENLDESDFFCRYLVTLSGYQAAAESFLIDTFKPVWNKEVQICFGFGKHGDAAKTRANRKSPWDTVHPGRPWAADNQDNERSAEQIVADIQEHYRRHAPDAMRHLMRDFTDLLGDGGRGESPSADSD